MRFHSFVAAAALLSASLAAHADTLNYTVTGGGNTVTFSLDQNPALSFSDGPGHAFVTEPVTVNVTGTHISNVNGTKFLSRIEFAEPGYGYFQFSIEDYGFSPYDDSGNNLYFSGDVSTPTLLTGTFTFDDAFYSGPYTVVVADVSSSPVSATPEPSSIALLGTGLLGVAGVVRKRFAS